jgi:hypothetical protein
MADSVTVPKFWNVSATLRGFYDDNYAVSPTSKSSFGTELLPTISLHVPLKQTDLGIRYSYGLYYYEERHSNPFDQTHQVDLWLDHAFNERWHVKVTDTFAAGQDPQLTNPNTTGANATYRVNGDFISNHGEVKLSTDWSRLFSTDLTYDNSFYDYSNSGTTAGLLAPPYTITPTTLGLTHSGASGWQSLSGAPSLAGILDRVEQDVSLDLKWHILPETTAFIGYEFSWVNYTGNEPIAVVNYVHLPTLVPQSLVYKSSDRDNTTHYGYLGIEQQFTSNLSGTIRGGASYTDSYADPLFPSTSWAPYADVSLAYTYRPGSFVQLGFTHDIGATDQVQPDAAGQLTQYSESSVIYLDVNHRFTPKLSASAIGRIQYSTYQGGQASSMDETDYGLGLNVTYQINQHFSVDAGYNYDDLVTAIAGAGYTRNRVYLGLTANY